MECPLVCATLDTNKMEEASVSPPVPLKHAVMENANSFREHLLANATLDSPKTKVVHVFHFARVLNAKTVDARLSVENLCALATLASSKILEAFAQV